MSTEDAELYQGRYIPFLPGHEDMYKLPRMEVAEGGTGGTAGMVALMAVAKCWAADNTPRLVHSGRCPLRIQR